VISLT